MSNNKAFVQRSHTVLLGQLSAMKVSKQSQNIVRQYLSLPDNAHTGKGMCAFRGHPATRFGMLRPPISASSGHSFRGHPATYDDVIG
jgi:hypothetical protein